MTPITVCMSVYRWVYAYNMYVCVSVCEYVSWVCMYECVYVVVVLGGRGSGWSGRFYFVAFYFFSFLSHKATPFYRWKHWILVNRKSFLPDDTSRQTSLQTLCLSSQEAFRLVAMRAVVQWVSKLILKQVMCPSWCSDPNMRQRL